MDFIVWPDPSPLAQGQNLRLNLFYALRPFLRLRCLSWVFFLGLFLKVFVLGLHLRSSSKALVSSLRLRSLS